jgi:16S rRNA (guanine527-N7)-methyltransferase
VTDSLYNICVKLNLPVNDSQLHMLQNYAEMVLRWNSIVNLTGSKTVSEFVCDHVVDGLAVVPFLKNEKAIIDVGSGGGIPGVIIKIMCPKSRITLLEPRARRARFLEQVRIELGLQELDVLGLKLQKLSLTKSTTKTTLITRAFGKMGDFARQCQSVRPQLSKIYFLKAGIDPRDVAEAEEILGRSQIIPLSVPGYLKRSLVEFNNLKLG